ncbi:hypothetical protein [Paenibacillus wenxiniae]|uniref:Lipoprotein n=1 Tax=Paenibacillus wenxiniae TaxID=1636843 RepID=A0ABW4RES7_9BACL
MKSTYKITTLGTAVAAVLWLGACSNEAATGTAGQTTTPATEQSTPAPTGTGNEATATDPTEATGTTGSEATTGEQPATNNASATSGANSTTEATNATTSTRPATQTFELMDKGKLVKHTTKLQQGNGYSLYVFDGYTLDKQKNRLQLTSFPEYYVDIQKLDTKTSIDELRKQGMAALKRYGTPKEYSGDQLYESPMAPAKLYLQISSEKGTYDYIVWEDQKGSQYTFLIHNPQATPSDLSTVPTTTSLATIEADGAS